MKGHLMPEETENLGDGLDVTAEFEDWLNERAVKPPGIMVHDIDMMEIVLLIRLRSVFTLGELHARAHQILAQAEHFVTTPGAMVDEDGNTIPAMLRENFQGSQEELADMLKSMVDPGSKMDAGLEALLGQEEQE